MSAAIRTDDQAVAAMDRAEADPAESADAVDLVREYVTGELADRELEFGDWRRDRLRGLLGRCDKLAGQGLRGLFGDQS